MPQQHFHGQAASEYASSEGMDFHQFQPDPAIGGYFGYILQLNAYKQHVISQRSPTRDNHKTLMNKFHAVDQGAAAVQQSFRSKLLRKYHTVVGAWRALDPQRHGRVSFFELCRAVKSLGFACDSRILWQALDADQDGFLTLYDLDEPVAQILEEFASAVTAVFRSADVAWQKQFGKNAGAGKCGRSSAEAFVNAARRMGYPEPDIIDVFTALNADRAPGGVLYEDFLLLDRWFARISHPPGTWHHNVLRPSQSLPALVRADSA